MNLNVIYGHELLHFIRQNNEELYNRMTDALLNMLAPQNFIKDYVNRMSQSWLSEQGWKLDEEALGNSEIIDGMKRMEKMLADRLNWPLFSQSFKNDAYNRVHAGNKGFSKHHSIRLFEDFHQLIMDVLVWRQAPDHRDDAAREVLFIVLQLLKLRVVRRITVGAVA